jgi:hypothetical protein
MPTDANPPLLSRKRLIEVAGTLFYYGLIALAIVLFLLVLSRGIQKNGWDAKVFCFAGEAIGAGGNPYLAVVPGTDNSLNYLPIYAYGFHILCSRFAFLGIYVSLYTILFLFSLEMWVSERSWLYGLILCATGLFSFGWVLRSGNIGTLELFFVAASALLLLKNKNNWALFVLGLITSLKIIPIFYWPLFIALVPGRKPKQTAALWGFAGLLMPFLLSAITYPALMPWFFRKSLGLLPGQLAPIQEEGGMNNPSFYYIPIDLFSVHLGPLTKEIFAVVIFVLMIAVSVYIWKKIIPNVPKAQQREFTIALGILATTLFLPRLKPYSFMPALLFVYVLTRSYKNWVRGLFILLLSIIPILIYNTRNSHVVNSLLNRFPAVLQHLIQIVRIYHQPFFLLCALVVIVLINSKFRFPAKKAQGETHVQD